MTARQLPAVRQPVWSLPPSNKKCGRRPVAIEKNRPEDGPDRTGPDRTGPDHTGQYGVIHGVYGAPAASNSASNASKALK